MTRDGNGSVAKGFPRAIVCVGCSGQYFASSLLIHQRSCFERNAFVSITCPKCRTSIRTGVYHAHVDSCTGKTASVSEDSVAACLDPRGSASCHRERNNPSELNSPEMDGRVRCKCCGRPFHQDRIAKHQAVCVGPPPSRSRTAGATNGHALATRTTPQQPKSTVGAANSVRSLPPPTTATGPRAQHAHDHRSGDRRRYDAVTRDASRQCSSGSSSGSGSGYPGASRMLAGRWDAASSNASSAGNPLVTNRMMTVPTAGASC